VHWLAYLSWPVALTHALGTGSDARTGWLAAAHAQDRTGAVTVDASSSPNAAGTRSRG
jgi:hypothetical protein